MQVIANALACANQQITELGPPYLPRRNGLQRAAKFNPSTIETLRNCYALLADFVPDDVAERNRNLTAETAIGDTADLEASRDEMGRLVKGRLPLVLD